MATTDAKQRVALRPEDLLRVRRLTEEVKSRLYEIGLITARTLDREIAPGTLIKYEPRQDADRPEQTIEVVIIVLPDGTVCCTQDPPGESICPC